MTTTKKAGGARALGAYYQFNIEVYEYTSIYGPTKGQTIRACKFTKASTGESIRDQKLTPAQWRKASHLLTRELRPFIGYRYEPKEGTALGVYKII